MEPSCRVPGSLVVIERFINTWCMVVRLARLLLPKTIEPRQRQRQRNAEYLVGLMRKMCPSHLSLAEPKSSSCCTMTMVLVQSAVRSNIGAAVWRSAAGAARGFATSADDLVRIINSIAWWRASITSS